VNPRRTPLIVPEEDAMEIVEARNCPQKKIETFPYKGKMHKVIGTSIAWLSQFGDDGNGYPEYGLRYFTIEPGGQIPMHNHFYIQTMFILDGTFECYAYDPKTDKVVESKICGAGSSIYIPSMDPHGMKNIGDVPAHFLCCICNVYDSQETL
jgi:quercetin dioxygenase-like cupin family protein